MLVMAVYWNTVFLFIGDVVSDTYVVHSILYPFVYVSVLLTQLYI